jgi:hypothetical protein
MTARRFPPPWSVEGQAAVLLPAMDHPLDIRKNGCGFRLGRRDNEEYLYFRISGCIDRGAIYSCTTGTSTSDARGGKGASEICLQNRAKRAKPESMQRERRL